jgi:protein N-lysine methyltransferase METTL21A
MPASTISSPSRSPSPRSENDVFSISHSLIPEPTRKSAGTSSLDFDGLLENPLRLHEDLQEGCGGQLWPAGMTLARFMLQNHQTSLVDKHVIELGAGGGLVGLAVALGCKIDSRILLTDQQPMLSLMQQNISLNALDSQVRAEVFDWGSKPPPTFPTRSGHPDIVLAADCVYFEPTFPLLLSTLKDLLGPETICYFCFKKRRKADLRFIRDMTKTFDVCEIIEHQAQQDRKQGIFLYRVLRKGGT